MKDLDEKNAYLGTRKMPFFSCFENIVGNKEISCYEQILHFQQGFPYCNQLQWHEKGVSVR